MEVEKNRKLITAILHKGIAVNIIKHLNEEMGINTANVSSGRGSGMVQRISSGEVEVDILTVVVGEERADEVFKYIYDEAELGYDFVGFMFQGPLLEATKFTMPDIPTEEEAEAKAKAEKAKAS